MNIEEKRLKVMKTLLMIKITNIEEGKKFKTYHFKFRKLHPFIIALAIYSIAYEIIKEAISLCKECFSELNTETHIQVRK